MEATPTANQSYRLIQALFNPVARTILRSPLYGLMSSRLLLITFTGRKSGKRYTVPISYVQLEDNTLLLVVGGRWWKNLRGGATVELRLHGKARQGEAEIVTDEKQVIELYTRVLAENPTQARFLGVRGEADGKPNRDDLHRALQRGAALVKIHVQ